MPAPAPAAETADSLQQQYRELNAQWVKAEEEARTYVHKINAIHAQFDASGITGDRSSATLQLYENKAAAATQREAELGDKLNAIEHQLTAMGADIPPPVKPTVPLPAVSGAVRAGVAPAVAAAAAASASSSSTSTGVGGLPKDPDAGETNDTTNTTNASEEAVPYRADPGDLLQRDRDIDGPLAGVAEEGKTDAAGTTAAPTGQGQGAPPFGTFDVNKSLGDLNNGLEPEGEGKEEGAEGTTLTGTTTSDESEHAPEQGQAGFDVNKSLGDLNNGLEPQGEGKEEEDAAAPQFTSYDEALDAVQNWEGSAANPIATHMHSDDLLKNEKHPFFGLDSNDLEAALSDPYNQGIKEGIMSQGHLNAAIVRQIQHLEAKKALDGKLTSQDEAHLQALIRDGHAGSNKLKEYHMLFRVPNPLPKLPPLPTVTAASPEKQSAKPPAIPPSPIPTVGSPRPPIQSPEGVVSPRNRGRQPKVPEPPEIPAASASSGAPPDADALGDAAGLITDAATNMLPMTRNGGVPKHGDKVLGLAENSGTDIRDAHHAAALEAADGTHPIDDAGGPADSHLAPPPVKETKKKGSKADRDLAAAQGGLVIHGKTRGASASAAPRVDPRDAEDIAHAAATVANALPPVRGRGGPSGTVIPPGSPPLTHVEKALKEIEAEEAANKGRFGGISGMVQRGLGLLLGGPTINDSINDTINADRDIPPNPADALSPIPRRGLTKAQQELLVNDTLGTAHTPKVPESHKRP